MECLYGLSQVALSDDLNVAMVYASRYRGPLNAQGDVYLLQRTAAGWVIVHRAMCWIS